MYIFEYFSSVFNTAVECMWKSIQDFSLVSCFTSPKYNIVVSQKVLRLMCLTVTIVTRSTCSVSRPSDQLSRVDLGDLWPLLRSYETEFWVNSSWNIFWRLSDEEDGSFLSSSSPGLTLVLTWSSPGPPLVITWSSPGPTQLFYCSKGQLLPWIVPT